MDHHHQDAEEKCHPGDLIAKFCLGHAFLLSPIYPSYLSPLLIPLHDSHHLIHQTEGGRHVQHPSGGHLAGQTVHLFR